MSALSRFAFLTGLLVLAGPSLAETRRQHNIVITTDETPAASRGPIGPVPYLDEKLERAPAPQELKNALADSSDPLYPVARFYLDLDRALGNERSNLCVDLVVKNGSARFVVSLPTDDSFEIGAQTWTAKGASNFKKLKKALAAASTHLRIARGSNLPVDWDIEGYADGLPYLDFMARASFYDIRQSFDLSFDEKLRDLERQQALALSRAESYRIPIENPEEGLRELVRIRSVRGHASDQLELDSTLWSSQNRAVPAEKTFFKEASLLACKARRKIKFTTTGVSGSFPVFRRISMIEESPEPVFRSVRVADLPVVPHSMSRSTLEAVKEGILREIDQSIHQFGLRAPSGDESVRATDAVLNDLAARGVFIGCVAEDYLCTMAKAFIRSRLEGKGDDATAGDHLISLIGSGLSSLRRFALNIPKEIDRSTVQTVGDLVALYRVPEEKRLEYGETRIRGEALLAQNPYALNAEGVRVTVPDGNYTCARCGSGSIVKSGSLIPNSRIVDQPDAFRESIARIVRTDSSALGAAMSPGAYFVPDCNADCTRCGGLPIDEAVTQALSGRDASSKVRVVNPAIRSGNATPLIPFEEFRTGCVVTRNILESCNVEPEESHDFGSHAFDLHMEEIPSGPAVVRAESAGTPSPDAAALEEALDRLRCSSSRDTALPTWDQYGDCHLDAWRPEKGPGSYEWLKENLKTRSLNEPLDDQLPLGEPI